jgi:nitrite reductase (NADH) large subunit
MDYIILGNGVAGISAAQTLSAKMSTGSTITQFTDEPIPGYYNRPKIPTFIANNDLTIKDVIAYDLDWYARKKISLHFNEKINHIDFNKKTVKSSKGSYSFDRMLIATGAGCKYPPIAGQNLDHFYTIRNLTDAMKIRKRLKFSTAAVILGGGLLGLETASAASLQGLNTTVVEFFPYLLPRQLDEEGGKILQRILESRGMTIMVGKAAERIQGASEVESVVLKDGIEIPTNIVLTCTGIEPRIELIKEELLVNKGITVNNFLETSKKDIYAAGDCAEFQGRIYGLIPPAMQQANIAAANMISPRSEEYQGSKISSTVKITDLFLSSLGYKGNETDLGYESMKFIGEEQYVKLFINEDKLKAAIILGVRKLLPIVRKIFNKELSVSNNLSEMKEIIPNLKYT